MNLIKREGFFTRRVEKQTAKIPSLAFMGLAGGSIIASLGLFLAGKKSLSQLIGMWVPTILITGLYNKVVKEAT